MSLSLYDITIPGFIHNIKVLLDLIEKGVAHVGKGNESKITESRLVEDMFAFIYQVQRVSDISKGFACRVGGFEAAVFEDNEKTIPEIQERLRKTLAILESVDPKSMIGKEETMIAVPPSTQYSGKDYALKRAIPNFYFHFVMAYALLRKEGVPIGKRDYLGIAK